MGRAYLIEVAASQIAVPPCASLSLPSQSRARCKPIFVVAAMMITRMASRRRFEADLEVGLGSRSDGGRRGRKLLPQQHRKDDGQHRRNGGE